MNLRKVLGAGPGNHWAPVTCHGSSPALSQTPFGRQLGVSVTLPFARSQVCTLSICATCGSFPVESGSLLSPAVPSPRPLLLSARERPQDRIRYFFDSARKLVFHFPARQDPQIIIPTSGQPEGDSLDVSRLKYYLNFPASKLGLRVLAGPRRDALIIT